MIECKEHCQEHENRTSQIASLETKIKTVCKDRSERFQEMRAEADKMWKRFEGLCTALDDKVSSATFKWLFGGLVFCLITVIGLNITLIGVVYNNSEKNMDIMTQHTESNQDNISHVSMRLARLEGKHNEDAE